MNDNDAFAPLGEGQSSSRRSRSEWHSIVPVPDDAPRPPASHSRFGKPAGTWTYRDEAGRLLGFVRRFNTADGKQFLPLTFGRVTEDAKPEWKFKSWPGKRPLYGLDRLAERLQAPVLVTEGEKAADAAAQLLLDMVVVTSPNGSKSASKADWSTLRGRAVTIWPDSDAAGLQYAEDVAKLARAAGAEPITIISPPPGVVTGWDADDALTAGWTSAQAAQLVADARLAPNGGGAGDAGDSGRRRSTQRDVVIDLTDCCEFWHDANRLAYATFPVNSHQENWPLKSREFRMWLSGRYYQATGRAIGGQSLEDAIRILEARAVHDGRQYKPFTRVGEHAGKIYLDLCDARWRSVEINRSDWRTVVAAPVKFMRPASLRPMQEPEAGGMIEELRSYLNVPEDQWMLIVGWLVATLRPKGPYPILVLNGEQGSGKSMASRMLRELVDPSAAAIRSVPKDDHNLIVSASNSHILGFDNLSNVPPWLADALCRLSTGGGYATRTLHTDRDETIFEGQRPIMLNGIPLLTDRADLADRALTVHLRAIPEGERQPEDEIWANFARARPRLLGALLSAMSAALRNLPQTKLERSGRMADFEKLVTAAESGLGWDAGSFQKVVRANREEITESAYEADSVAVAIGKVVRRDFPDGLTCTATELLTRLNASDLVSDGVRKQRSWPTTAQGLGNRIDRISPLLKSRGFKVERRHSGSRTITIVPPPEPATNEEEESDVER
ncbi:ATP-binding protein [Bradyrhizobium sp. CIAT3101]|uniref:ATP-binding protein n=1 Tax=Bradyrhizobium sp. CIAT3101 TaxID=439387 RepID=UPI0024B10DE7|nr:ATP-binding protein [Bradyrhizobium sp. CIAT3101]WFU84833.1 ATP-binding protein [Bradyrhizobium sp. CIAT3101]